MAKRITGFLLLMLVWVPQLVFAQSSGIATVKLKNPLGDDVSGFPELIERILKAAFVIGLPVAVLFIVFAGFKFVAARGNQEKLTVARNNLLWTVVGIGIFFGAWVLAKIIAGTMCSIGVQGVC